MCGGCSSQDQAYTTQLSDKERTLCELFAGYWSAPIPVLPSPRIWHYRNRVELNFGRKHYPEPPPKAFVKETVLGFKRRGKWYWTLDLTTCRIGPVGLAELMRSVRDWYRKTELRAYDSRRGDGLLRHLIVREGHHTDQRMVVLTTAEPMERGTPTADRFVEAVQEAFAATTIYHGLNAGRGDQAVPQTLTLLDGPAHIEERLHISDGATSRNLRFRISPFGFFQTNTAATERLYGHIRAWVAALAPAVLYDLYGGSGGIALACADLADRVESVENWAPASEDGRHNATVNGIDNVRFTTAKVESFLGARKVERAAFESGSAVVLDPPRAGLHPKALRRLVELGPPHVLYVSCKPSVLARELEALATDYQLTDLSGFDLFPHTPHVEVVAALRRRDAAG